MLFEVGASHAFGQISEFNFCFPAEFGFGLGSVTEEEFNFGGTEIHRIDFDNWDARNLVDANFVDAFAFPAEFDIQFLTASLDEFSDTVGFTGGNHKVIRN